MDAAQNDLIGTSRALHYEEKLLWEHPQSDGSGVDLAVPSGLPLRTGVAARAVIGLPQLKEPQVLRHFVRLSTKNFSIDHGFFPLGSCTMKHNPRLNEKVARLSGFADIHPLQPAASVQGALVLMYELQNWLSMLTGLPGVCLAPAAGAHGELAGLMTIRRAHELSGQGHRHVILCPDSAHGTNPATAAMCGYTLRVIPTKETGCVTLEAFREALGDGTDVAGMMVTNPNTCGLFEREIARCAELLHQAGDIFTVTAQTLMRSWEMCVRLISVWTSCISICTKHFQRRMVAAGRDRARFASPKNSRLICRCRVWSNAEMCMSSIHWKSVHQLLDG